MSKAKLKMFKNTNILHNYCVGKTDVCGWVFKPYSSISSSDIATVLWLYRPWAINCNANGFFTPLDFLILARLFWNQILICASCNPNSFANSWRRFSVRYLFSANSFFSLLSWSPLNAVLGRFSSGFFSFFLTRRERGPINTQN